MKKGVRKKVIISISVILAIGLIVSIAVFGYFFMSEKKINDGTGWCLALNEISVK